MPSEVGPKVGSLVLKRRVGESVTINRGEIIIDVVSVSGSFVTLRFRAARDILILREEFMQKKDCTSASTDDKPNGKEG